MSPLERWYCLYKRYMLSLSNRCLNSKNYHPKIFYNLESDTMHFMLQINPEITFKRQTMSILSISSFNTFTRTFEKRVGLDNPIIAVLWRDSVMYPVASKIVRLEAIIISLFQPARFTEDFAFLLTYILAFKKYILSSSL